MFPRGIDLFAGTKEEGAEKAKRQADKPDEISFWTDDSKTNSRRTRVSQAWCDPDWKTQRTCLGTNTEVFDAKQYAIGEAVEIALQNRPKGREVGRHQSELRWTRVHIWVDSRAAIKRLQSTDPGPG